MAVLTDFQTCGLEEWISGSDTMLTTLSCTSSSGIIKDPAQIELFANFYGGTDEQQNAIFNSKHGMDPNNYHFSQTSAKILTIKKETFIKLIAHKNNVLLHRYAEDKLNFLSNRISYLSKNTNKHMHRLLYKDLDLDSL